MLRCFQGARKMWSPILNTLTPGTCPSVLECGILLYHLRAGSALLSGFSLGVPVRLIVDVLD